MRLDILNRGYGPGTKLLFALIRRLSGHPVPDAAKLVFYRPAFYGAAAKTFTHEVMRGPSDWSVADRELMAAYVSKLNGSAFCVAAHTATAARAYQNEPMVAAVLDNLEPVVALGQVEELVVLRHPEVRDDQPQPGMSDEQVGDGPGAGEGARHRGRPAMGDDRDPGVGQQSPDVAQQRIVGVVPADLQVALEHPCPWSNARRRSSSALGSA